MGGNLLLKYLGEERDLPTQLKGAVGISVPCQLADSLHRLQNLENFLYAKKFKKSLVHKLWEKHSSFPEKISVDEIKKIRTLKDFDDVYTSKAHGFKNADDYYAKCSARQFLSSIKLPTLIINAQNDSFLGKECYPIKEAQEHDNLYLEMSKYGGHVGFNGPNGVTYTESRALRFFEHLL